MIFIVGFKYVFVIFFKMSNQTSELPHRLVRQLTCHKIDYANYILDNIENPNGAYLLEMHASNYDITGQIQECDWTVHYIFVYNDGKREERCEQFRGTQSQVKQLFEYSLC